MEIVDIIPIPKKGECKMSYKEFKKTYSWMIKKYPETSNIYADNLKEIIGACKTTRYEKSGTRWKATETETNEMSREYYANCVDAIPFFRGLGGSERVTMGYTYQGYIPTEISSISPDGKSKVVRRFIIER